TPAVRAQSDAGLAPGPHPHRPRAPAGSAVAIPLREAAPGGRPQQVYPHRQGPRNKAGRGTAADPGEGGEGPCAPGRAAAPMPEPKGRSSRSSGAQSEPTYAVHSPLTVMTLKSGLTQVLFIAVNSFRWNTSRSHSSGPKRQRVGLALLEDDHDNMHS